MKTTLKEVKEMSAKDITRLSGNEVKKLMKEEDYFIKIAISSGIYGINGCVVKGAKTRTLYKITSRNSNLLYIV